MKKTLVKGGAQPASSKKYVISSVVLALAVALCLVVTVQTMTSGYASFFGFSFFRVVTPSMEPTIPTGSILICKSTPIEDVAVGDIICFKSRQPENFGAVITHRVVSVTRDEYGRVSLESRGDANYSSDPYPVREDNLIGRVVRYTEKEGVLAGFISFVSGKTGFMMLVVIPVLLIAGIILWGIGRNVKKELSSALDTIARRDKPLPGYKTLTRRDYEEIYRKLKEELRKELNESAESDTAKTEYSAEDEAK